MATQEIQQKKVGLALGGGAVLGAAHVGVLRALKELDISPDYIAGTSIGALVAALYAFGLDWEEIGQIASKLKWMDISSIAVSRYGLLSNDKLAELIKEYIGEKRIEEARIPLSIISTDITTGQKIVLDKGPVAKAIMASTCIPGIYKPVEIKGKMLVDGGIMENVPVKTVREMGANYVIGVDLNATHSYHKPKNILDVLINSFHFLIQQSNKPQTESADLLIQPDLDQFSKSDISQVDELMERGYNASVEVLAKAF